MTGSYHSPEACPEKKKPRTRPISGQYRELLSRSNRRAMVDYSALGVLFVRARIVLARGVLATYANEVFAGAGNAFNRHVSLAPAYGAQHAY